MIAVCLLKGYHVVGIVLSLVSVVFLLLSFMSSTRSVIVSSIIFCLGYISLRENCPNKEFFLVQISVFSPYAGKYGPEKLRIWTLFTQSIRHCLLFSCLLGSLTLPCCSLLVDIQSSLNHCSFFENFFMDLSSLIWHCLVHCSCSIIAIFSLKLLFIRFVISLPICFTDSNCLSYLDFCNCNSACTFSFIKFCNIYFSFRVSLPL